MIACSKLGGCKVGDAKLLPGFNLSAKNVIATVGPQNGDVEALANCYKSCFEIIKEKGFKSVAFPCIATGFYGFPNEDAAHIAYCSVRKFLEQEPNVDIILVQFAEIDVEIYNRIFTEYFTKE